MEQSSKNNPELTRGGVSSLERLLAATAIGFVNATSGFVDTAIQQALSHFATALSCNRAALFMIEEEIVTNTHEYCGPEVTPLSPLCQQIPFEGLGWVGGILLGKRSVVVEKPDDLPSGAGLNKSIFATRSLNALLCIPIRHENKLAGFLSLEAAHPLPWERETQETLTQLAIMLGSVIRRKQIDSELLETNDVLTVAMQELQHAQQHLIETEKMSALGGLVAGVAHEINTPIGIGVTAASHLQKQTEELLELFTAGQMKKSSLERYLAVAGESTTMILSNLKRAAELVQSFKQIAVDQSSDSIRCFPLKKYIQDLLVSLQPRFRHTQHTITLDIGEEIALNTTPGALSQILTNLIMNSLIHGFESIAEGTITISATLWGGRLSLIYQDNGRGIPAENLSQIFNPFFTTRRGSGGSGLGLHLVYNLVTQNLKGTIHCKSTPGAGTIFTLDLPEDLSLKEEGGPRLHTLVVDDDRDILTIAAKMLEELGCECVTASSGEEALACYTNTEKPFDLLVMDMIMPKLSGKETLQAMSRIRPLPPVLLASGFAISGQEAQDLTAIGVISFLKKPYRMAALAKALDAIPVDESQANQKPQMRETP